MYLTGGRALRLWAQINTFVSFVRNSYINGDCIKESLVLIEVMKISTTLVKYEHVQKFVTLMPRDVSVVT